MMLKRRQSIADAEDFAAEAITITLEWLGADEHPERRIWKYASTTCCRQLSAAIPDPVRPTVVCGILDEFAHSSSVQEFPDESGRWATHIVEALLTASNRTARKLLLLLKERELSNPQLAAELGVQKRTIELARETIRHRSEGIFASFFGGDPPSWCRRCRRPPDQEVERGNQAC